MGVDIYLFGEQRHYIVVPRKKEKLRVGHLGLANGHVFVCISVSA